MILVFHEAFKGNPTLYNFTCQRYRVVLYFSMIYYLFLESFTFFIFLFIHFIIWRNLYDDAQPFILMFMTTVTRCDEYDLHVYQVIASLVKINQVLESYWNRRISWFWWLDRLRYWTWTNHESSIFFFGSHLMECYRCLYVYSVCVGFFIF